MSNFIEGSMQTVDFKETVDEIINMIDDDLKSKSRVYTWFYYNEENPDSEFVNDLIEPWECTLKFVVFDNQKEVYTRIWDGRGYPKAIRDRIDITNKNVRIVLKDGKVITREKNEFFEERQGRLSPELNAIRSMIIDKGDLLAVIVKKICETCSTWGESAYASIKDYTPTFDVAGKSYPLNIKSANNQLFKEWEKLYAEQTKEYFSKR